MQRVGFVIKVKPERIAEYKERHKAVWPEMRQALSDSGWHNYSLFLAQDGTLFGYVEVPDDFTTALANMDKREVNQRWQTYMDGFFGIPDGLLADQAMLELEEVFHLE